MNDLNDRYIAVDGVQIRYRERLGDGVPLLMLHGISQSLEFWEPQLQAGIGDHRLIALDLPGHGLSELGDQPYDFDQFARFAVRFADALDLDKFFAVGHSMGAAISARLAERAPARVAGLVLISAAAMGKEIFPGFKIMTLPLLGEVMTANGKAGADQQVKGVFFKPETATSEIRQTVLRNMTKDGGAKAFLSTLRAMTTLSGQRPAGVEKTHAILGALTVPALIIHGMQDAVIPAEHSIEADAKTPVSELLLIDVCGHTPQLEHPDRVNEALLAFTG